MKSKVSRRRFINSVGLGAGFAIIGFPKISLAQTSVHVIDGYPAHAMWIKELSEFFLPEINKNLISIGADEFLWKESYGGATVKPKGVLDGIKEGRGDIGVVTTIFHSSKLPSQAIAAVTPMVSTDSRIVAKAVDEIAQEYPDMQQEFEA